MSHPQSAVSPTAAIAQHVKTLRARRGWSATELGRRLNEHDVPWDRFGVTSLENGKRQNVTVQELLALALVFDVAPVNLLVPTGSSAYQITPKRAEHTSDARAWVTGRKPLPGADEQAYLSEAPVTDREPAGAAVRALHNDVEAAVLRADAVRIPDDFPHHLSLARLSLKRVDAELDSLHARHETALARRGDAGPDDGFTESFEAAREEARRATELRNAEGGDGGK